jgi:hypothetical protein
VRCWEPPDLGAADVGDHPVGEGADQAKLVAARGRLRSEAPEALAELSARYGLEMDPGSIPGLLERFGLRMGERQEI